MQKDLHEGKKRQRKRSKKAEDKGIKPFLKAKNKDRTAFGLNHPEILIPKAGTEIEGMQNRLFLQTR
jgi:hypothetical protein